MKQQTLSARGAVDWAASATPSQVLSGAPRCREAVLRQDGDNEIGLWEVTPGRFASKKETIGEVMTFLSGAGHIEHADGSVTEIGPGVVLHVLPGWQGIWDVSDTVVKSYVIYPA